jgi:CrcB protein
VALVAAGGVLGAPARYAISQALPDSGRAFPTATFITNLTGALVLGALLEGLARLGPDEGWRRSARLLVGTGMCGAYTTYSTFTVESDQLLRAHRVGLAAVYAVGSVVLGLFATGLGIALAAGYHRGRGTPAVLGIDPDAGGVPRAAGTSDPPDPPGPPAGDEGR